MTNAVSVSLRAGDALLLLMPSYRQAHAIRARLAEVQQQYQGSVTTPLHFVCLRLRGEPDGLEPLAPALCDLARRTPPIEITGLRLEPFYSSFHQRESLKCHIELSDGLLNFVRALGCLLEGLGLESVAPDPRVTLLDGIRVERLRVQEYRQRLFLGERLVLAQARGPGRYRALLSVPLGEPLPAEPVPDILRLDGPG